MAGQQPQGAKTKSGDELQLVVFNIGKEEFGVEIMRVQEIIRMTSITGIPQAPDYIPTLSKFYSKNFHNQYA